MDESTVLARKIEEEDSFSDYLDRVYGKMEEQKEVHNGEVKVKLPSADLIRDLLGNLNTGVEGGGNYVVFRPDRIELISDADKLGIKQYATIYPRSDLYTFLPSLSLESRRTSRIIVKCRFSAMKAALTRDRGTKTKERRLEIHKESGSPKMNLSIVTLESSSSPSTLDCTIISQLPKRPDGGTNQVYTGSLSQMSKALSPICTSKAERVRTYIKNDGSGIFFYAYHAVTGFGVRSPIGRVTADDFETIDKGTRLLPRDSTAFMEYNLSKKALKCIQKLTNESGDDVVTFYSGASGVLRVECAIGEAPDEHILYLY